MLSDLVSLFYSFSLDERSAYDFFVCPKELSFKEDVGMPLAVNILDDKGRGDLGSSIFYSMEALFSKGYDFVCIIATDNPFLSIELIAKVFTYLKRGYDFVLGPDLSGGAYLIAASTLYPIFSQIKWSEGKDYDILTERIKDRNLSCYALEKQYDIDTIDDLLKAKAIILDKPALFKSNMPKTYDFIKESLF